MTTTISKTRFEVSVAHATVSPKTPDRNQDRVALFGEEGKPPGRGVVVCDGVGSLPDSGEVAERVARIAAGHLTDRGLHDGIATCVDAVADAFGHEDDDGRGRTTMIVVGGDDDGRVAFTFVGNGALLELQGAPLGGGRTRLWWVNHMVPHISYDLGREALSAYLPAASGGPLAGTGTLSVTGEVSRLFLACTDGILSAEDVRTGKMPDGSTWTEVPEPVASLLEDLVERWSDLQSSETGTSAVRLQETLTTSLEALHGRGLLEDDATVGAVWVRPVPTAPKSDAG